MILIRNLKLAPEADEAELKTLAAKSCVCLRRS